MFDEQLDTMVSELAHDVRITMSPRDGYRISGVFGVPDGLMTDAGDGAVTITVPTAFLSTNGGGIFLSLAKAGARAYLPAASSRRRSPLLEVSLTYVGAQDGRQGTDRLDGRPRRRRRRARRCGSPICWSTNISRCAPPPPPSTSATIRARPSGC